MTAAEDKSKNSAMLRNFVLNLGAAVFGAAPSAPVRKDFFLPPGAADGLDTAVSFGVALSRKILETVADRPNRLYYFHYQRTNILIDHISSRITDYIQKEGFGALPVPASQISDWEKQTAHVNHREVARLAGLGRIGRNNLLVNPDYGAGLRFATVLTDFPLEHDVPSESDCGMCRICADLCPAGAIKENSFDKDACLAKLKEFMRTEHIGQMICGVCVRACPAPKFSKKR